MGAGLFTGVNEIAIALQVPRAESIRQLLKRLGPGNQPGHEAESLLNGVVSGLLNKEIASELGITERTVKAHRGRATAKMGAKSSAEVIKMPLTIQLNGKEQEATVQSLMSPENASALTFIADLLQTTPEAFLEHVVSTAATRSTPGELHILRRPFMGGSSHLGRQRKAPRTNSRN
jgi:hypothetical protein